MKPQKSAVQLLVLLEIIALIAALIFGIMHGGKTAVQSNSFKPPAQNHTTNVGPETTENDNAIIVHHELQPVSFSEEVVAKLASMTIEEKVAQMFFITPEALTHNDAVTVAGNGTRDALNTYPVGGLVYSDRNFQSQSQTSSMLSGVQGYSNDRIGLPMFLGIEEAGGINYSPLATANSFPIQKSPAELGDDGDIEATALAADAIANYLAEQGFNLNFAPTADIAGGINIAADGKTYGSDAALAAQMVEGSINAYHTNEIATVTGNFPGKEMGNSNDKDLSEWRANNLLPYETAIRNRSDFIMLGNVTCGAITGDNTTPCSISGEAVYYLRNDLGYTGILITDNLSDPMITENFSSGEAAVEAVKAGVNMIYCPQDFEEAYTAILEAVESGEITTEAIDQAAGYILTQKLAMPNGGQE